MSTASSSVKSEWLTFKKNLVNLDTNQFNGYFYSLNSDLRNNISTMFVQIYSASIDTLIQDLPTNPRIRQNYYSTIY